MEQHYETSSQQSTNNSASTALLAIFAFVMAICGIFIILGIVFSLVDRYQKNICSESVTAIVTDVDMRLGSDSEGRIKHYWYPTYSFEYEGKEYEIESSVGRGPVNPYDIGDEITLKINPANPKQIREDGNNVFGILGIIFIIVGAGLELLFGGVILSIKKNLKSQKGI